MNSTRQKLFVLVPCMIVASMIYSADFEDEDKAQLHVRCEHIYFRGPKIVAAHEMTVDTKTETVKNLVDKLNSIPELFVDKLTDKVVPGFAVVELLHGDVNLMDAPNAFLSELGMRNNGPSYNL